MCIKGCLWYAVQLPEGEFVKGFVQDMLKQLGTGKASFPQQIVQLGMQVTAMDPPWGGKFRHLISPRWPEEMKRTSLLNLLFYISGGSPVSLNCHSEDFLLGKAGFYRLLKSWGMDPGLEFKVAMEEAERLQARLIYGDADQEHTMRRIAQSFSMQVLIKLITVFLVHYLVQGHHRSDWWLGQLYPLMCLAS